MSDIKLPSEYILRVFGDKLKCISLRGKPLSKDLRKYLSVHKKVILQKLKNKPLVLSFAEQRMWFLSQYENKLRSNSAYNISIAIEFQGELDSALLQASFQKIIHRHENLRTIFLDNKGKPERKILTSDETKFLLEKAIVEDKNKLQAKLTEFAAKEFVLDKWPLFSVKLIELATDSYVLMLVKHHIISDGWSLGIMLRELCVFYNAAINNQAIMLEKLTLQPADFALWQQQLLKEQKYSKEFEFWQQQLLEAPNLKIATDFPRPKYKTYNGDTVCFNIPRTVYQQLKEFLKRQDATLFMGLLSVCYVVLARLSGQYDLIIGIPIANRAFKATENILALLVNSLALRCRFNEEIDFCQFISLVKNKCIDAYARQNLPFEYIIDKLKIERDPGISPVFQVMCALQNAHTQNLYNFSFAKLKTKILNINRKIARFDLLFNFSEAKDGVFCELEFNTDLYSKATVLRIAQYFKNLLVDVLAKPNKAIKYAKMLNAWDFRRLETLNFPEDTNSYNILEIFEQQVLNFPDNYAVICGKEKLTYAQLNKRSNQLAHYIRANFEYNFLGSTENLIGLAIEQSIRLVVAMLAVIKLGGAYVPLDIRSPHSRLSAIIRAARIKILLTETVLDKKLRFNHKIKFTQLCIDNSLIFSEYLAYNPQVDIKTNQLACVIYTSGSSSSPKAVAIEHAAVTNLVINTNYIKIQPTDRIAQIANPSFDAATFEIWGALLNGASSVIITKQTVLALAEFKYELFRQQITTLFVTTALFNFFAENDPEIFFSCKNLLFGGEMANPKIVKKLLKIKPAGLNLIHVYGPTECTTFTTFCLLYSGLVNLDQ